jgi:PEP-CTERM motif
MKVLLATAAVLLFSGAASADSFDTVNLTGTTNTVPGVTAQKTMSFSFTRDTSTNALRNFVLNAAPPVGGFSRTPPHALGERAMAVSTSFSAAEPGTLALLGVGLVGFLLRKPKKPAISATWEPLA